MNEHTDAHRRAARALDARWPTERHAAVGLAVAQRDLATALAGSPEKIADDEPGLSDPGAEYQAWLRRMVDSERRARDSAASSVAAGHHDDDRPDPQRLPVHVDLAAEFADSVARAHAAIAALSGPNRAAALAAREDVLRRWPTDDETAAAALAAQVDHPEREA